MKPTNFPGRKNKRRILAMGQLLSAKNTKADRLNRPPKFVREAEIAALKTAILPNDTARSIRTKINRSARGKLRV